MAGLLAYNIQDLAKDYMASEVDVKIKIDHEPELKFPAITICNMNPIKEDEVARSNDIKQVLEATDSLGTTTSKKRRKRSSKLLIF